MKRKFIVLVTVTAILLGTTTVETSHVEVARVMPAADPPVEIEVIEPVITASERDLIERVVFTESGGEPSIESEMAVAQVIKDRSELWGKSVTAVLTAPKQFGKPSKIDIVPDRTKEAVRRVFDQGERVFAEPTTHFYAYNLCSPGWAETKTSRGVIANHRFMY